MRGVWLLLLVSPLTLAARYDSTGDFQIWNKYSLTQPLRGGVSSLSEYEFRFGDKGQRLYYWYAQWHLVYCPYPWLEIAPSYRQAFRRLRRRNDRVSAEGDPMLAVTVMWREKRWVFRDRNRFQYRFFFRRQLPDDFLYRNRLMVEYQIVRGRWRVSSFASNEIFFSSEVGFSQSRLKIGGDIQRHDLIRFQVFYLFRYVRGIYQNGLGIHLYLDL